MRRTKKKTKIDNNDFVFMQIMALIRFKIHFLTFSLLFVLSSEHLMLFISLVQRLFSSTLLFIVVVVVDGIQCRHIGDFMLDGIYNNNNLFAPE